VITLVQRVLSASVEVDGKGVGNIGRGLLVFAGNERKDSEEDLQYTAAKVVNLRIFEDEAGKLNLSLKDIDGEMLIVSQFTLAGDVTKGKRPSFNRAMEADRASLFYEKFVDIVKKSGVKNVQTGIFKAMMEVKLINWGPVTIIIDSQKRL